jgi:hypothetical protein
MNDLDDFSPGTQVCTRCGRRVSDQSDEYRQWLHVENDAGELVERVCPV